MEQRVSDERLDVLERMTRAPLTPGRADRRRFSNDNMVLDLIADLRDCRSALARAEQERDEAREIIRESEASHCDSIKKWCAVESERDEARASVARLREALCCLMDIDGSPESLDLMRVGIVASAEAPDEGARVAAFACIDALAATAPPEEGEK